MYLNVYRIKYYPNIMNTVRELWGIPLVMSLLNGDSKVVTSQHFYINRGKGRTFDLACSQLTAPAPMSWRLEPDLCLTWLDMGTCK